MKIKLNLILLILSALAIFLFVKLINILIVLIVLISFIIIISIYHFLNLHKSGKGLKLFELFNYEIINLFFLNLFLILETSVFVYLNKDIINLEKYFIEWLIIFNLIVITRYIRLYNKGIRSCFLFIYVIILVIISIFVSFNLYQNIISVYPEYTIYVLAKVPCLILLAYIYNNLLHYQYNLEQLTPKVKNKYDLLIFVNISINIIVLLLIHFNLLAYNFYALLLIIFTILLLKSSKYLVS